mmetsp:Transcript_48299/g.54711  ORF Transcript_48299/g.54711 Transcript_48299/m.54711 type:complete len:86 (-) Transcript_48299:32-289(-)
MILLMTMIVVWIELVVDQYVHWIASWYKSPPYKIVILTTTEKVTPIIVTIHMATFAKREMKGEWNTFTSFFFAEIWVTRSTNSTV